MDDRTLKAIFGEWLCSQSSNPLVNFGIRADLMMDYSRDYLIVTFIMDS